MELKKDDIKHSFRFNYSYAHKMTIHKAILIPKNGKPRLKMISQHIHYQYINSLASKLNTLTHITTHYEKHI